MPLALGLAATSAAGVSPGPRGDDVGSGAVTAAGNGLGGTRSSWVCSEPAHGLTIDATSMTAASAMTAIGRRLARRTGTVSTRNGGDVMATVCVWLSTLAGSRSGRRGAWMVGARYHPDSPTSARVASGWKAPYGRPGAVRSSSRRRPVRAPGSNMSHPQKGVRSSRRRWTARGRLVRILGQEDPLRGQYKTNARSDHGSLRQPRRPRERRACRAVFRHVRPRARAVDRRAPRRAAGPPHGPGDLRGALADGAVINGDRRAAEPDGRAAEDRPVADAARAPGVAQRSRPGGRSRDGHR